MYLTNSIIEKIKQLFLKLDRKKKILTILILSSGILVLILLVINPKLAYTILIILFIINLILKRRNRTKND
tara:strand:+ start:926 stop:1138 length:213 start_codon:yes stop_codon:yes gene_type:complete